MTDCYQTQLGFQELGSREVCATFDAGNVTSDAGGLLLREVALRTSLLHEFAGCFSDGRDSRYVSHPLQQLVAQRVFALALGYEDVNDQDHLREDPLLAVMCERKDLDRLGGKSTLNRLEQGGRKHRYQRITWDEAAIDDLLVRFFLRSFREIPAQLILDLDATDIPLHGDQEARHFHGYYDGYCYLPLLITCGDHILCARLRPSNIDAPAGSVDELERIVAAIRARFPKTHLIVRADSGFAREAIMAWCESHHVDYVLGLARNSRLVAEIGNELEDAKHEHEQTGQSARRFREFMWTTRESWSTTRRVVAKAEHLEKGSNPRFIVTSLSASRWPAQALYEQTYCARGDMENRIKEHQADMFGDRMSTHTMRSNQLRLYFSTIAYMLLTTLRREALVGTELEKAQAGTIRLRLLKIGALVRVSVRRVWIRIASGYPYRELLETILSRIRKIPVAVA
jgi:hypothetical protein